MADKLATDPTRQSWLYHPRFPGQWTRSALYSLATWVNGLAFRNIQFSETGMPVIKIAEIKGGLSGQTKFTQQTFDESVRVRPGDMLFSWSGQPETSIDVFWWNGPEGWLNQHVFRVTPKPCVHRTFFYYLLRYLRPNFVGIASNKQTTGLGHVTKRDLENMEVAYPDPKEQQAIACILGALDDKIELNRRRNRTLEAMARAIFQSWFVDFDPVKAKAAVRREHPKWTDEQVSRAACPKLKPEIATLFPDRFEDSPLGPIPADWRARPLPEVCEVNPPRSLSRGTVAPYLDMANMPTQGPSPESWVMREMGTGMKFINGDTLVARITPCLENGKTAFVDFLQDGQVGWGSTEYIVLRPRGTIPPVFAYVLARTEGFRSFAIQQMTGSSGRQRVPADSLSKFQITTPEVGAELFHLFGKLVAPLFERIKVSMAQSRTLAALRDALLPKLISGELRVPDAERIVGRAV
jgi:type I restriction enzyme S subunit